MRGPDGKRRVAVLSGLNTALYMIAPLGVMLLIASAIDRLIGSEVQSESEVGIAVFFALGLASGALWGRAIARLAGTGHERRMQIAGALSLAPAILFDVWLLITLDEQGVLRRLGFDDLPIHNQYTLIFVFSAFVVAAAGAFALGLAATTWRTAARNAALTGLAAAGVFLLVNVGLDLLGYRVGAPRTGLSATLPPMPTVTITGTIVASLVGGAIGGLLLSGVESETEGERA